MAVNSLDEQFADFFKPEDELSFQVRLPNPIRPEAPPGVLVYISPKAGAQVPVGWADVLDKNNLIWVAALDSGNEEHVARRATKAVLALLVATEASPIDSARVILSGFSGGGRVASMMMPMYHGLFCGALFICGANPLFNAAQETLAALKKKPMVFLTGTGDFNLEDTQMAIQSYHQAGLLAAELSIVEGLGHALPDGQDLQSALSFASPRIMDDKRNN